MGGGYLFRGQIKHFLDFFIAAVDDWGVWGYAAYAAVYTALEVLAVPAVPLTMTAGAIFGPLPGTIVVSLSGTLAATIAFLIARYAARDKVRVCVCARGVRVLAAARCVVLPLTLGPDHNPLAHSHKQPTAAHTTAPHRTTDREAGVPQQALCRRRPRDLAQRPQVCDAAAAEPAAAARGQQLPLRAHLC
jgi:hypothetical protein